MKDTVVQKEGSKAEKVILIAVSVIFVVFMLVLPLVAVIANSLKEGLAFYLDSLKTEYVVSALKVTLIATIFAIVVNTFFGIMASWALTKFSFHGKQLHQTRNLLSHYLFESLTQ